MDSAQISEIIRLIWPIALLQLILQIFAIIDILKKKRTRNLSMTVWILIILLGEVLGPIVYFLTGRAEE